jgi:hypothetical protein
LDAKAPTHQRQELDGRLHELADQLRLVVAQHHQHLLIGASVV